MKLVLNFSLILVLLTTIGCDSSDFRESKTFAGGVTATADQLNVGKRYYSEHCFACHGVDGGGNGPASKGLVPPPRNFKQGLFKFGWVPAGELPTDEDLYRIIKKGLHGTAMLPWDLEKPAIMAVIQYIKTFAPKQWSKENDLGVPFKTVVNPYGAAHKASAIQRGKEVYHAAANCQSCHRAYVTIDEFIKINKKVNNETLSRSDIEDDFYKLKLQDSEYEYDGTEMTVKYLPPDFTWHEVKSAQTVEELFLRIKAGVGGTSMPSWHEVLSDEDIWAVSHYVKDLMEMRTNGERRKALMEKLGK